MSTVREIFKKITSERALAYHEGEPPPEVLCSICNKPQEVIMKDIPLVGKMWCPIVCQCRLDQMEQDKKAQEQRELQAKIQRALKLSSELERLKSFTFANLRIRRGSENAIQQVEQRVRDFNPKDSEGLLIFGRTGNGKSHITAAGANALMDRGYAVIYLTEKDLLKRFQATNSYTNKESYHELMDVCLSADLLVYDDFLSSQSLMPQERDVIFSIFNGRERANKPIWATSNITEQDLATATDSDGIAYRLDDKGRTWSRIMGNMDLVQNRALDLRIVRRMAKMKGISEEEYERQQWAKVDENRQKN